MPSKAPAAPITPLPTITITYQSSPTLSQTATPLPSPTENLVHTNGQVVKVSSLVIAIIDVNYTPTQVQVTFAAKNTGTNALDVDNISAIQSRDI